MATCNLYKGCQILGAGVITSGSPTVSSWVAQANTPAIARREIMVEIPSSTHVGSGFQTRVLADDGGGNLTLKDTSPFAT